MAMTSIPYSLEFSIEGSIDGRTQQSQIELHPQRQLACPACLLNEASTKIDKPPQRAIF